MRPQTLWMAVGLLAGVATAAAADCGNAAADLRHQPTEAQWRQIGALKVVSWLTEVEGSPVKEGVAVGKVAAAPERVFRVVTDNGRFADFMPFVEESTVEILEDGSTVNFQHLDLPWPISDREYKVLLHNSEREEEREFWRAAWSHVKGFGNIEESHGAWRIWPCGEDSLVEYQVFTDPGGSIPTYFKNKATRRSLGRLIAAVRSRAGDPIYDAND